MPSPKTPSVVKRALLYKDLLNDMVESAVMDMSDQWVKISVGLHKNIDDLVKEMAIRDVASMPLAERARWMAEFDRYQDLLAQSDALAAKYGNWAANYVYDAQYSAVRLGINEFSAVTQGYFVGMPSPQIEFLHGSLTGKSPLLSLFNQIGSKDEMENALLMGLTLGKPLSEIGKDLAEAANITLARGTLIARTEVIRAHNTTSLNLYQMYGIEKYRRLASKGHACIACLMLDGEILVSRDALYDHPNGACTTIPIVDPDNPPNWETGKEYFEKLPEAEQRQRMGTNFYDAWKRGDFTLQDLVSIRHDPIWGDSPQITPLKTLSPNWKSYRQNSGTSGGSQVTAQQVREKLLQDLLNLKNVDYNTKIQFLMTNMNSIQSLSLTEIEAFQSYTGSSYMDLNRRLRNERKLSWSDKVLDDRLQAAFAKLKPTEADVVVERGCGTWKPNANVGEYVVDKGYMSTSISGGFGGNRYEILVPKGSTNVAYVGEISHFKNERELLFNKNSILELVDFVPPTWSGDNGIYRFVYRGVLGN